MIFMINSVVQVAEVCEKVLYGFEAFSFSASWMPAPGSVTATAAAPGCALCATGRDGCGTARGGHGQRRLWHCLGRARGAHSAGKRREELLFGSVSHPVSPCSPCDSAADSWSAGKVSFSFSCFKGVPG